MHKFKLNLHNPSMFFWMSLYILEAKASGFVLNNSNRYNSQFSLAIKAYAESNTILQTITIIYLHVIWIVLLSFVWGTTSIGSLGHRSFRFIIRLEGSIDALGVEWYMLQFAAQSSWAYHQNNSHYRNTSFCLL